MSCCNYYPQLPEPPKCQELNTTLETVRFVFHPSDRKIIRLLVKQFQIVSVTKQPDISDDNIIVRASPVIIEYKSKDSEAVFQRSFNVDFN